VAFFATTGVILSAGYALWLYRRVVFGALEKESLKSILDLDLREKVILVPMIILTIFFGFYPMAILDVTQGAVDNLITTYNAALEAAGQVQHAAAH
jgi:NADH-quinone oxidoreductase subunit M